MASQTAEWGTCARRCLRISPEPGRRTASTGAGGNDELIYTAPPAVFPGSDRFTYTLGDTTGEQTVGDVALRVDSPGLVGYWKLDGDAADASGGERHGTIEGATFTLGVYGQALQFDGSNDDVVIPGLNRDMPSMTITTWLRRWLARGPPHCC